MIMLVLLLSLPAMTASAKDPLRSAAIMLTTPSPSPVSIGSEITFDLFLSVANIEPGISGADIYLKYNPMFVEPTPGAVVAEVLPDFFGVPYSTSINTVLPAAQCPNNSDGPCIHLVIAGTPQITKNALTARFHFRSLAAGHTCFSVIQSNLVDADGFQVDHIKAEPKCGDIVVNAAITGVVRRQGTPSNPNPSGGNLSCARVTVISTSTFGPAYTDRNGSFTLSNLPAGAYTLRAFYPGYLSSEKAISITATNPPVIDFATTTLRGGDIDGNNLINILDIGAITGRFGKPASAVGSTSANCSITDDPADINDDGQINISDLAIAAGNWKDPGPTSWQP
jgi:hypothetical protein